MSKRADKITLNPHIQHTHSLNSYRLIDATELWAPEQPDTETDTDTDTDTETVSFLRQSSHEHVTLNTQHYYTLFIHHTYLFFISNLHIPDLYTHNCLYYILCICFFVHCLFVYYSFIICVLSCCCHSVALRSFCHYNKFLVCVNIPGQ